MLHRVVNPDLKVDEKDAVVRIADASFPVPFAHRLEFNAPVHGTWNIVHIGMLVPECHQIYVCADNCLRGVVLTAAEMGAADRFSSVLIEENDIYDGSLENITIEGVSDVIRRLPYRPRAAAVFLVCLHHFVGTDAAYVYRTLEERFPDIDFMRCWMDPVMQKTGLTPEQKLKESMFRPVRPLPVDPKLVCVLGDNMPLYPDSDIALAVKEAGCRVLQLHDWAKHAERIGISSLINSGTSHSDSQNAHMMICKTYEDYLQIGAASLFITRSLTGIHGVTQLAKRLGRPVLYLPPAAGQEEISREIEMLRRALGENTAAAATAETSAVEAEKALAHAHELIWDTEITIDYIANPRPLSLSRRLLESGFRVTRVYLDAILPEEEADFLWLQHNHPDLELAATIHPKMRVLHKKENGGNMLAIGPKAAWFGGTAHFVNLVEFGGMWGNSGIVKLAALMEDAYLHKKDTKAIVPRKGQGCACVF